MLKKILIREKAGIERIDEYVRAAIPCARGELKPNVDLAVVDPSGRTRPCQKSVLKLWPDGSVKWLLIDFAASAAADSQSTWQLTVAPNASEPAAAVRIMPDGSCWQVDTGVGWFLIDTCRFRPFAAVHGDTGSLLAPAGSSCCLRLEAGGPLDTEIDEILVEEPGPIHAIIRINGTFLTPFRPRLCFSSRLHFYANSMMVKIEMTLHNPRPAQHPKGLWDLGDPGSVLLRELEFCFPLSEGSCREIVCYSEPGSTSIDLDGDRKLSLYQESSGGDQWQSPNHRNRDGSVPMIRKGYVVETDDQMVASGDRATPEVWCGAGKQGVAIAVPRFWQEFPKHLEAGRNRLQLGLFPERFPDHHELQGGERKTHEFFIDFSSSPGCLTWSLQPLQVIASPCEYHSSGIFGDLPGPNDLVDRFITAEQVVAKRELVDEYGWRHYGEIYADHEAVHDDGSTPFSSHYNNQYDVLAGAFRKAFASGNFVWLELAVELGRHVLDIDIYHTDLDREEYNHGLFWHTDHYARAGLATHRSYSREQTAAYQDHVGGGGPGAEHCYASGLMLHYFQTGHPDFSQAVIDLADWELRSLTGPQALPAVIKRGLGYLQLWLQNRDRSRLFPRLPLTRATGNAITACLDAFEVSGERRYLDQADRLIRQALHPCDDLQGRDLLNAEVSWSYTVLLAAVSRFLDTKLEWAERDAGFAHARESLLTYARWMVEHEYPYLNHPEILEFPNETWVAQDLRKSVVLYHAARYSASAEEQVTFLQKAIFFFDYVRAELPAHPGTNSSRPVALLLQNGWCGEHLRKPLPTCAGQAFAPGRTGMTIGRPVPYLTAASVMRRFAAEFYESVKTMSIRRELVWLRSKLPG